MTFQSELTYSKLQEDNLLINLAGNWRLENSLPLVADVERHIKINTEIKKLCFNTDNIKEWDTALLTFLIKVSKLCSQHNIETDNNGLPEGVKRLLTLAAAVPERKGIPHGTEHRIFVTRIGLAIIEYWKKSGETLYFIGDTFLAFLNMMRGKARFRRSDLFIIIQESGAQALPIVTLISLLIGLILAFIGSIQLKMFGAEIFVANLVGIGMAREMGAMMTAIIMAGRTGAAFAAQLGSMHVNDEIDAYRTFGISPVDALVLPRMIALVLMMPLLCIYANFLGIIGGAIVGVTTLDISFTQYFEQTKSNVGFMDFVAGFIKSGVFGLIIAVAGCLKGMQCGKSSTDVGKATTSAVVTSIVFIIVSDAILTIIYSVIGI